MNVAQLQANLAQAGFSPGAVDAQMGPATYGALICYAANRPKAIDALFRTLGAAVAGHFPAYGIVEDLELVHWIAQGCHETENYQFFTERGGPTYFAQYEGRADLGNTQPGDGYRFRGRGIFQITGRWNYRHFGQAIAEPLEDQPDLAADPTIAVILACQFWTERGLGPLADLDDVEGVTRKINGGLNGLADRQALTQRLKAICGL